MTQKICPICKSALEAPLASAKQLCSNAHCDYVYLPGQALVWYQGLAEDAAYWHEAAFVDFPPVLAHEYRRLRQLLAAGQSYGALLQLKDVFEVMLKFPMLAAAACLWQRHAKSLEPEQARLLFGLQGKLLGLGDWLSLAETLLRHPPAELPTLTELLKSVVAFFSEEALVPWRNNEIGHGALAFDTDLDFQKDLADKLKQLAAHFVGQHARYAALELWGENNHLLGAEQARQLEPDTGRLELRTDAQAIDLHPYLQWRDQGLYFFDTYDLRSTQTTFLNYVAGKRQRRNDADLDEIVRQMAQKQQQMAHETQQATLRGTLEDPLYSRTQAELLALIEREADYLEPSYLANWLRQALKSHNKGVFLLQMASGMGKSTFSRALDPMQLNKLRLPGTAVRAYYCNDSYRSRGDAFLSKLTTELCKDNQGHNEIENFKYLPSPSPDSPQPGKDLGQMLDAYAQVYREKWQQGKLLLIVDGLDEVTRREGLRSVWDFLPTSDELGEGVYLLVTCRIDDEIAGATRSTLQGLQPIAKRVVSPEDPENLQLLRQFITQKHPLKQWTEHLQDLLQAASNRFLYVRMLQLLLEANPAQDLTALPQKQALIPHYLQQLEKRYGPVYFSQVLKLLCALSLAGEPLSLQELAWLLLEGPPTFQFLARVLDIRLFLKAERSPRGNLFTLLDEMQVYLQGSQAELQTACRREYALQARELLDKAPPPSPSDGESWLIAHALAFLPWQPSEWNQTSLAAANGLTKSFAIWGDSLVRETKAYRLSRCLAVYGQAIEIWEALDRAGQLRDRNHLANVYMNRAVSYYSLTRYEEALADSARAIEIWEALDRAGQLRDRNHLANVYMNRAATYDSLTRYEDALADYARAIEIWEALDRAGQLHDRNDLARVYMNRAITYRALTRYEEALADYARAIEIREALDRAGQLHDRNDLATVYMNRAVSYYSLTRYEDALADYARAIEIWEALDRAGQLHDRNYLATIYMNRAITYRALTRYEEALTDYARAIKIWEDLLPSRPHLAPNLAQTYLNRAICYLHQKEHQLARTDAERVQSLVPGMADEVLAYIEAHEQEERPGNEP